jgi:oxygen-independent coproporphyrinogen-3 oxidase
MAELMIMGMRLVSEGVSAEAFALRFNVGLEEVYGEEIERLLRWGLVEWSGDNANILRLTEGGRLLGNRVFREFL